MLPETVNDISNLQAGIFRHTQRLMGNRFEFTVCVDDAAEARAHIAAAVEEVARIEKLLTTFNASSQTSRVNESAGIHPVTVEKEFFELVKRSKRISSITQGAFDISYGSADKRFWNFDTSMTRLPDRAIAREMVKLVNYKNIVLDEVHTTVFLRMQGMRIGFGGIGKGYAAEMAKQLLQHRGVQSGIVNAAGDLTTWGRPPDGTAWTVGIADPNASGHLFSSLNISNTSIATSGSYEKFVEIDGRRYSHTIDPKTGWPVSGIKSVSIICPNAELADALATPVMVMGVEQGLFLINQLQQVACIIVDDLNHIHTSNNIHLT